MQMQGFEQDVYFGALQSVNEIVEAFVHCFAEDGDLPGLLVGGEIAETLYKFALAGAVGIDDDQVGVAFAQAQHRLIRRAG